MLGAHGLLASVLHLLAHAVRDPAPSPSCSTGRSTMPPSCDLLPTVPARAIWVPHYSDEATVLPTPSFYMATIFEILIFIED
eukprot:6209471-Pleurochrysis_carterae.AAC.3